MAARNPRTTAASKVLGNYELLEQILLHLPLRSLLLSRSINKATSEVCQRSLRIPRALFLAPRSQPVSRTKYDKDKFSDSYKRETPVLNPFLHLTIDEIMVGQDKKITQPQNEALHNKDVFLLASEDKEPYVAALVFVCRRQDLTRCDLGGRGQMLLTHPPTAELHMLELRLKKRLFERAANASAVEVNGGITYADLVRMGPAGWRKRPQGMKALIDSPFWLQFSGSIDSITGAQMLDMMDMEVEKLLRRELVVPLGRRGASKA